MNYTIFWTKEAEQGLTTAWSVIRMAYEPPLGIDFEIIEDDKKVRVLRVWSLD